MPTRPTVSPNRLAGGKTSTGSRELVMTSVAVVMAGSAEMVEGGESDGSIAYSQDGALSRANTGSSPVESADDLENRSRGEKPMSCYVMLEFTAKPGTGPALAEALQQALPVTRRKEGCESLQLIVNQDETDNMVIVMLWRSRSHYDTYRAWREASGDVKSFAEATTSGLSTRFFDILPG